MTDRKGSLMQWRGECGHWFVVYSLEPTPPLCPDCAETQVSKEDESRKVLADIVNDISLGHFDECPGQYELDEWLDECGVTAPEIRADIAVLAGFVDEVHAAEERAEEEAYRILKKYPEKLVPKPERLTMP